ncbi:MAG: hypothetical protein ABI867_15140 [Kofleriaceae bacterium]
MRNAGLFAFGLTTLILAPAAINHLTAGSKQVAKLVAPDTQQITIDGVTIDTAMDRGIVDPGDRVKLTLTATSAEAKQIALDVLVMESSGSDGGRVETPPVKVAREHVVLHVKAGEPATKELAFTLRGARGNGMGGMDPYGRYAFLVMTPKAADTFEKLRRSALRDNSMAGEGEAYNAFISEWYALGNDEEDDTEPSKLGKRGQVARLDVSTRAKDSPVALTVPDTVRVDEKFKVTVKVANKTKFPANHLHISLDVPGSLQGTYLGIARDSVEITIPEDLELSLKPHESKSVQLEVTAKVAGVLGLYATVECDDCHGFYMDGALEAIDVEAAAPAIVGQQ